MGKHLNPGLRQGISNMSLEHLMVPESKEVLTKPTLMGVWQRDPGANGKSQSHNNVSNRINRVVLDYTPNYQINIHRFTLI